MTPVDRSAAATEGTPEGSPGGGLAPFPVVGIGASAGGLQAIEALVRRLRPVQMAFVVVQHTSPGHEGGIADVIRGYSTLPVAPAVAGSRIEPGHIYVAPSGLALELDDGVFRVVEREAGPRLPIDAFFRSLAQERGSLAVGVVLSGSGSDGTLGLQAIKQAGGITFAQDAGSSSYPSMPERAFQAGHADFSIGPGEIADELVRLATHPWLAARPSLNFDAAARRGVCELLDQRFGVDFAAYKPSTVDRRIQRRVALRRLDSLGEYLDLLRLDGSELGALYHDLLIGVTGFFRDPDAFEALATQAVPRLIERHRGDGVIRVWAAGCATGEEAYSLGMCLLEGLDGQAAMKLEVFASDVDGRALELARQGVYPSDIELDVSEARLARFFTRTERGWVVSQRLREAVVFAQHDLTRDPPFSRLGLVSCRNVLIYMQPTLQRRLLRTFHYALEEGGYLLLGTSESAMEQLFSTVDRRVKLFTRRGGRTHSPFLSTVERNKQPLEARPQAPAIGLQLLADRSVIERYGPPGVVVDQELEILQFRGRTGPFLEATPGAASLNLLRHARPELLIELRATTQRALAEDTPSTSNPIKLHDPQGDRTVVLDVLPLGESGAGRKTLLVLFDDRAARSTARAEAPQGAPPEPGIEGELALTKQYLQVTIEELEATNEELTCANEELQSTNEELQSANEELTTSREELQSTNEELESVNEELMVRMDELATSGDDLASVLETSTTAVLLVGRDLEIRRCSAAAQRLLGLVQADVGRPLSSLLGAVRAPDLEAVVTTALDDGKPRDVKARVAGAGWHTVRVTPRAERDGAVIELVATQIARPDASPVEDWASDLFMALPLPCAVVDEALRVVLLNRAFTRTFATDGDTFGRPLERLWGARPAEELWGRLEEAAARGASFAPVRVDRPLERTDLGAMTVRGCCIPGEGERPPLVLLQFEPVRS